MNIKIHLLYFKSQVDIILPMIRMLVGNRIKELRINNLNMTQNELADKLKWDRTFLSRVESGKQNITIDSLEHVCNVLNISLKDFFQYMDNEHITEDYYL